MAGGLNRNITVRLLADTSNFTAGMAKVSGESQKAATTMEATGGKTKLVLKIGRAVQQECRDRSRMPSSA